MPVPKKKNTFVALLIQVMILLGPSVFNYLLLLTEPVSLGIRISRLASLFYGVLGMIAFWFLWNYYNDTKFAKGSTLRVWGCICLLLSIIPVLYPFQILMMYPEFVFSTIPSLVFGVLLMMSALILIKNSGTTV